MQVHAVDSPCTPVVRSLANLQLASDATSCFTLHERRSAFEHVIRVLEEAAINRELPNKSVLFFRQDSYAELVMGFGIKGSGESRNSQNKISAFWKHTVKSTVKSFNKTASSITNLGVIIKGSPSATGAEERATLTLQGLCTRPTTFTPVSDQTVDVLSAAAPTTGEALHWAWLLRSVSYRSTNPKHGTVLEYVARAVSNISRDASWFMLLIAELHALLQGGGMYTPGSSDAVEAVAARAVQLAEGAIAGFRTNYTTAPANAEMLVLAVQLLNSVSMLLHGGQGQVDIMLRETMLFATQQRYNALSEAVEPTVAGLARLVEQLVSDVVDDVEHYNAALPATCNLSLPQLSCSVYCPGARERLAAVVPAAAGDAAHAQVDRPFLALVAAVAKLEALAARWLPERGPLGAHADIGSGLLAPHVTAWFAATRMELERVSASVLAAEQHRPAPAPPRSRMHSPTKHAAGSYHTAALDEFATALRALIDTGAQVMAAHQRYAALMERTISKAVLHHAAAIEARGIAEVAQGDPPLSTALCLCLNDLREIRTRQADLAAVMKKRIPKSWWSSRQEVSDEGCIGNRFRLCQGEIERRYTCVLFHVVRSVSRPTEATLCGLLDAADRHAHDATTPPSTAFMLQPLVSHLEAVFGHAAPRLDPRVLRRLAKEVWNKAAGQLHDALTGELREKEDLKPSGSIYNSVDNLLPRIRAADGALQFLNEYFCTLAHAGLAGEEQPERVKQLANLLAFFLREDFSDSHKSLDGLGGA